MSPEGFMRRVELHTMELLLGALAPKQRVRKGEVVLGVMNKRARLLWVAAVRAQYSLDGADKDRATLKFFAYLSNIYPELGQYKDVAIRRGWKVVGVGKCDKKRSR